MSQFSAEPQTPLTLGGVPLVDKVAWVKDHCRGQRVLHAGPTDYPVTEDRAQRGELLHQHLQGVCAELVGVDLARSSIAHLREKYQIVDIVEGDLEQLDAAFERGRFDVVLAGDVIEHLSNVGHFFAGAKHVLKPGGELLITVPNAFSAKRFLGAFFLRQERNHPDHLYYFSIMNLQQAAWRFGFEITEVAGFMFNAPERRDNRRANRLVRGLMWLTGNHFLADELAVAMKPR